MPAASSVSCAGNAWGDFVSSRSLGVVERAVGGLEHRLEIDVLIGCAARSEGCGDVQASGSPVFDGGACLFGDLARGVQFSTGEDQQQFLAADPV